jgi:hypothetical protein
MPNTKNEPRRKRACGLVGEEHRRIVKAAVSLMVLMLVCYGCSRDAVVQEEDPVERDIQQANSWKEGDPLPKALLTYSSSHPEGYCIPFPSGTEWIVHNITNYALLKRVALETNIHSRIFSNVVNRALILAGPTRFFGDLKSEKNVPVALSEQAGVKHVVVDSFYINFKDMPGEEAKRVLEEAKKEIEDGAAFETVYRKYCERSSYVKELHLADGKIAKQSLTKIGNLGDFVLPENGNALFSHRESWMPKTHVESLMNAKAGEVRIDFDKEDLSNYPDVKGTGERYVLHHVREVYEPKNERGKRD